MPLGNGFFFFLVGQVEDVDDSFQAVLGAFLNDVRGDVFVVECLVYYVSVYTTYVSEAVANVSKSFVLSY